MKKIFLIILILLVGVLGLAYVFARYAGIVADPVEHEQVINSEVVNQKEKNSPEPVEYEIVEVARDLFVPWSLVFTGNNRILVAERNGYIKQIVDNNLNERELYYFDDVATGDEEGLMGMTAHPNYAQNKYIYACYAYSTGNGLADRVVRLIDNEDEITFDRLILEDIPAARFHAGCRIKFGPDGKLYITTGDATDKNIAQDPDSLGGKILRVNEDGSNLEIYSMGHRNPQGIDWDEQGNLYSSEHGPSGFDGPGGGDELNLITQDSNYGWPIVSHQESDARFVDPLVVWTPAIAPASLLVYKSDLLPQFRGDIFIGGLRGEGIYRVIVDNSQIGKWEKFITGYGRIREVIASPNGEIFFTTSNLDGRGPTNEGDDKVYKLTPVN